MILGLTALELLALVAVLLVCLAVAAAHLNYRRRR